MKTTVQMQAAARSGTFTVGIRHQTRVCVFFAVNYLVRRQQITHKDPERRVLGRRALKHAALNQIHWCTLCFMCLLKAQRPRLFLSLGGSHLHVEAIKKKKKKQREKLSGRRQFSRSASLKIPPYPRQHMILFAAAGRACLLLSDTHACLLITTGTSGSDDDYQL